MALFGVVRLSTGRGYFSLTFSSYDFRMFSRVFRLSLLWVVSAGSLAPASAFADMGDGNALGENGGIAGGFFSSAPMTPAAMPLPLPAGGPDLCGPAIAGASASHDLPAGLLDAIAVVESGRLNPRTRDLKPWPWTIDANGAGYTYATEQAAGITSLDIGCLQVNLAQHPDAFQNLAQAFDPAANADYAAGFLTRLKQKLGDWAQAVAAIIRRRRRWVGPTRHGFMRNGARRTDGAGGIRPAGRWAGGRVVASGGLAADGVRDVLADSADANAGAAE